MIPALAPIGRTTRKLNPELLHANEMFAAAYTAGNVPEMKRWSKRLDELEAAHA